MPRLYVYGGPRCTFQSLGHVKVRSNMRVFLSLSLLMVLATVGRGATPTTKPSSERFGFRDMVKLEVTDELLIVRSNGIPDHTTGVFPNRSNPNMIREQNYVFKIPRHPVYSK